MVELRAAAPWQHTALSAWGSLQGSFQVAGVHEDCQRGCAWCVLFLFFKNLFYYFFIGV